MVRPGRADAAAGTGGIPLERVVRRLRDAGVVREVRGDPATPLFGVCQDSREIKGGDLFLAWKGTESDAHDFVPGAIRAGAAAVVAEERVEGPGAPTVLVDDGRLAAALAADEMLGSPGEDLFLAAITGTNGKTTTACLARHLLELPPTDEKGTRKSVALGTLGLVDRNGTVRPGTQGLTSPGPVAFAAWLRLLAEEGMDSVVVEASSHALDQHRLDGARFQAAAFTNLAHDHLDYHGDLAAYRTAKLRLAELLAPDGTAVVNGAEPAWESVDVAAGEVVRFYAPAGQGADAAGEGPESAAGTEAAQEEEPTEGASRGAGGHEGGGIRLRAENVRTGPTGSSFRMEWTSDAASSDQGVDVHLPLLGRFNVENALAAAGLALAGGRSVEDVGAALAKCPQVPGRLEVVTREPATVVVDFAHTPEALAGALDTLRPLFSGRMITVFGAGGDRDPSKRAPMGEVVAGRTDIPVVTSDNPRSEDPGAIVDAIIQGMGPGEFHRVMDRRQAIQRALDLAEAGDCVLVAGKGHEDYQEVDGERIPFDDRAVVREILGLPAPEGAE